MSLVNLGCARKLISRRYFAVAPWYEEDVRRLVAAVLSAVLSAMPSGCTLRHEVGRDVLQTHVRAQFPIEKTAGFWTVRVHDPVLRLDGQANRLSLELGIVAVGLAPEGNGVGFRTVTGRAGLEGRIEYDRGAGAFYIREPSIRRLKFADVPAEVEVALRLAAEAAIRVVLRERPVYVLDPKRSERDGLIKDHLKRVWVEGDRLVVEYQL
ncbi:MAG: DUF1439 domain-containing protein [Minicystis sp.]